MVQLKAVRRLNASSFGTAMKAGGYCSVNKRCRFSEWRLGAKREGSDVRFGLIADVQSVRFLDGSGREAGATRTRSLLALLGPSRHPPLIGGRCADNNVFIELVCANLHSLTLVVALYGEL